MQNFRQSGRVLTITVDDTNGVSSGDLVIVGALVGVAAKNAAATEEVEIQMEGVFELPKVTADVISAGDLLYWDGTKLTVTPSTGRTLVGAATKDAGNGATTVECKLGVHGLTS